ncbi:MAG: TetR/AcrR family transcriptional regulator [Psychrobium sp.]|nr:TetR/AcrR family transcriptional regulator [Psychrobium sp.]
MTLARANSKEDKLQKHQAIIDAAATLFKQQQCLPTVATIAKSSGQAKGTVYLYFSSKEAIYLNLLQQHYRFWFQQILSTLKSSHNLADIINCLLLYPEQEEVFFNLASLSCSILEPATDDEFNLQYRQWFNQQLQLIAQSMHQQFPTLSEQQALNLLTDSHALILGLWQHKSKQPELTFTSIAKTALARLWKGYFVK